MAEQPPERLPIAASITALAERIGEPAFVSACVGLMGGAPREAYAEELRGLTGLDGLPDPSSWKDYWLRTWGARGLLHVWPDSGSGSGSGSGSATVAVVRGLDDEHYRPAEMCLKVATRHEVAGTGDGAARLAGHELPRVRAQAMRCLAVSGDREHADVVRAGLEDPDDAVRRQAARTWEALVHRLDL